MKTTLEYALEYCGKDFSVIPILPKEKKPGIQSWELNKTRRADEKQIVEWFSDGESNVAIITGNISRLLAFDIDGDAASEQFYNIVDGLNDESIKASVKNTMCIRTGSGNTNVIVGFTPKDFLQGEEIKNRVLWSGNDNHHEIRLKGEGSYIVVPPSVHPNGRRYEFVNGNSVIIFTREQLQKIIAAFENHSDFESISEDSSSHKGNIVATKAVQLNKKQVEILVSTLKQYYHHGNRNDFILYLSGWLRKEAVSLDSAVKVIDELAGEDEEKQSRLRTLAETYGKDNVHDIKGYSGLLTLLSEQIPDEGKARQILKRIN